MTEGQAKQDSWEAFRKAWNIPERPLTHRDRVIFDAGWQAGSAWAPEQIEPR